MGQIFRFDDVSINTDMVELNAMTDLLIEKGWRVAWAVSIGVYKHAEKGRVFPRKLHTKPFYQAFLMPEKVGVPEIRHDVKIYSHGLVHVDHRLLSKGAQELSIIYSCSVLDTLSFMPPFGKWDYRTLKVCKFNAITIIGEDGFPCRSAEHEPYAAKMNFYAHPYAFGLEQLKAWLP